MQHKLKFSQKAIIIINFIFLNKAKFFSKFISSQKWFQVLRCNIFPYISKRKNILFALIQLQGLRQSACTSVNKMYKVLFSSHGIA